MQNIKYHLLNILAVILFSYILASTVNQLFRLSIAPIYMEDSVKKDKSFSTKSSNKSFEEYNTILDAGFFQLADNIEETSTPDKITPLTPDNLKDLQLLGTVTGPKKIARALIRKQREKESKVFKLGNDVYGYKLTRIANSKVYLQMGDETEILDMYKKRDKEQNSHGRTSDKSGKSNLKKKSISRSEIQQKVLNNMDNALKGIRAGPYRVDGKIQGYKLFRVRPNNILYELGARSGDIVKRINGHPVDSTERLLKMWQSVQDETVITIDLERGGQLKSFEFNIKE